MALISMYLKGEVLWDTQKNQAVLTLVGDDVPPPPEMPEGAQWRPGSGTVVTITVPVQPRAVEAEPTGIVVAPTSGGSWIATKYDWDSRKEQWVNPRRVLADGSEYRP